MCLDSTVVLTMPPEETSWPANGFGVWEEDREELCQGSGDSLTICMEVICAPL